MKNLIGLLRNQFANIYKVFLFVIGIILLVMIFPKEGTFKYEFHKGKFWMHDDLIAPFDFAINKSEEDLTAEKDTTLKELKPFFRKDIEATKQKKTELQTAFDEAWTKKYKTQATSNEKEKNKQFANYIFDTIYNKGIIELVPEIENKPSDLTINLLNRNIAEARNLNTFFTIITADSFIKEKFSNSKTIDKELLIPLLESFVFQNVKYDPVITEKEKQTTLSKISNTSGMVETGQRIISKGEIITSEKYQELLSLKAEYQKQLGATSKYYIIILGQIILLSLSLIVLALFLYSFRREILIDNKNIVFILLVIIMMVLITSIVIRTNPSLLYLVPLCLVPIIIRVFFDTRLSLFVYLVTIMIIGFLAPNSFEYIFLQLIAGIITIISISNLERRAQFFLTSLFIFLTYSLIYIGLTMIQDGNIHNLSYIRFAFFGGSALMTLFSYPLIVLFEKMFGYVTDVSLMEISNTNTKLLRELATKAPGTFQHSMQVANMAEEVIFEIGGNALLTRAGALYHDIGKLNMPAYFIENQTYGINPHNELSYEESAEIIISHVIKGVEKAKKHNLPEQIIDFIRTHHGTRKTDYFYNKQRDDFPDEDFDESKYTYNGPIPFSKETAVVMVVDSVEAATRSLQSHDEEAINEMVDTIINKQIRLNQFVNSNITFRDIDKIKRILKRNLLSVHHIRLEYPVV